MVGHLLTEILRDFDRVQIALSRDEKLCNTGLDADQVMPHAILTHESYQRH